MNSRRFMCAPILRGIITVQFNPVKEGDMSALGHKRTYAAQQVMSALPTKAEHVRCS